MCSKHTLQDSNIEEEDNIEDDSPAVQQQELPEFREPVLHNIYYEPILDPDSEFPWHHPDNQILDSEINVPEFDMNQFHDPWNIYRGNIPPSTEQSNPTEQTIDDYQDMRKYAWDYMPPQQEQRNFDSNYEQKLQDHCQHVYEHNETNSYHSEHEHQSHSFPFHSESHNNPPHFNNSEHLNNNNTQQQLQDTQINSLHNYVEQQQINNHEPHNYHEHHYTYTNRLENNKSDLNVHNDESQNNNHVSNISHNIHDKEESKQNKKKDWTSRSQYRQQKKTEQVYTVMMDHVRMRCQHSSKTKVNGYDSDSDSDVYEELRPRHPYDGFYLRHRMTIDARGRKVCIHEIPFIPRSPTPESSEEFEDAIETILEDINDNTVNDEEIQTGVAANLARVVPGAPLQQDAVDELARRQGWEAGNIDYMGADSFDNIWAKISQTLNQPASQSEQSSEPQPKAVDETVAVAAVEAAPEKQTVLPASEKEVKETEVPKSTEPEPANIPVPAAEAKPSGKIEEPIPVPVEMAAEVPEIVDVVAPVEPSSPIVVTEQSEQTSIPVAALEALKIDEPLPEALLPVTVVEQPPVPEPTPEVPLSVPVVEQPPVPEPTPEVPSPVSVVEQPPVPEPTPEVPLPVTVVEQPPASEPTSETPASIPEAADLKPETPATKAEADSDSPPLANTPSKEEIPEAANAKTTEEAAQETRL